jgi:CRP-like cAMP-binding protein
MMSTYLPARAGSLDMSGVRTSALPLDHALTLLLADETEAALRWAAAALEHDPLLPGALVVTSRLLDQMGRMRAAIDGLRLAVRRATDTGDLPLAVAAIDDLRILGADVRDPLDQVAVAFCRGSPRLQGGQSDPATPRHGDFVEPISPFLAGPPLASRATQIVLAAKQAHAAAVGAERPALAAWPLFSALTRDALRDLLAAFHVITVPAGHRLVEEGVEGDAAYIVASGEVQLSRRAAPGENKPRLTLSSLGNGAFFGEMALLSRLPSATTATTTRPSILLVGNRDALVAVAARRPEVAIQLAAHCRRTSLANLGWTSPVVALIPKEERAALVERLQMRVFERGEKLVRDREDAKGMHLVVSGEVAIVGREWSERVLLATLGPGEAVGEVELVLCRQSYADAIAVRPTAALFLSREEYGALVQDRPAVLHGLYATAVRRHAETRLALDAGSAPVADDWLLDEEQTETRLVSGTDTAVPRRALAPPVPARTSTPPARAPVAEQPRSPAPVQGIPSVAPTSASIRPAPPPGMGRRSLLLVNPALNLAVGGALVACVAGVLGIFIVRDGHRTTLESARGAAASVTTTSVTQEMTPAPADAPVATAATTWTPIPPASSATATALESAAAAAAKASIRSRVARPPVILARPPAPVPASSEAASARSPAASSVTSASPPAGSTVPAPVAASKPPPAASLAAPSAAGTASSLATDEFGGRE